MRTLLSPASWMMPHSFCHARLSTTSFATLVLYSRDSPLFDFIESCLRNKYEMVVYEAASAIVNLPGCSAKELAPAVSGQHAFLHPAAFVFAYWEPSIRSGEKMPSSSHGLVLRSQGPQGHHSVRHCHRHYVLE